MHSAAPEVVLETHRILLRKFRPGVSHLLYDLDSDPEVMRYISKGQPTPFEKIEKEILPRLLADYAHSPPQGFWAAELKSTGEFIGWFHLRPDRISAGERELGYRLKQHVWGQGLATEGAIGLIQAGFRNWGAAKICARTLVANKASQRVMEKAGLRFECEFVYSLETIPGWTEDERRAVKFSKIRPA